MYLNNKIVIGDTNGKKVYIEPKMANRHGLIAGATGTGKTVTLKVLAESFSSAGVPVFLADVKGDLSGMCKPGVDSENMQERIQRFGLAETGFTYREFPTVFWDIYGQGGIPLHTTMSEMGPLLLSRLMELNDTQSELLHIVFKIADDEQLILTDTKDLKAMLNHVAENAAEYTTTYGNIAKQSINTILRAVVSLESQGGEAFFTEPGLNIADWFTTENGIGTINVLDSRQLVQSTTLYATFLLWMMSELFETLPEVGDLDKPRMIFFFDEAHLLFKDVPKAFIDKIEQVVKLIRSKGVGIYFVTQNPQDIPDAVLSQLGNKIQHALRAYTPKDEKAVRTAAESFRPNPEFDTKEAITALGTGEALVSVLDETGIPGIVERCFILPPQSYMGMISEEERTLKVNCSNLYLKYKDTVDPESAYEILTRLQAKKEAEAEEAAKAAAEAKEQAALAKQQAKEQAALEKQQAREQAALEKQKAKEAEAAAKAEQKAKEKAEREKKAALKRVGTSAAGTIGREVGNTLGKTVGGTFGKKLGGNLGASLGRNLLGTFLK